VRKFLTACLVFAVLIAVTAPAVAASQPFDAWLADLRQEALGKGISARTLDQAFAGVAPIPRVVELDRRQPEFTLTFEQYLARVVPDQRVERGRRLLKEHAELLDKVSKQYGVQKRFIVALWGVETDFGRVTGGFSVIASLATLAHDGRRASFFRGQLLDALKILEQGHIQAAEMKGSWAGAMGQSQFMPSSFHAFAVDQNGDGSKNIWGSLPDVFGSIANYLAKSGWRDDMNWGRRIMVPTDFPLDLAGIETRKSMREWEALGVRLPSGQMLPGRDLQASVILPQKGERSPAYLAYENYRTTLKWNRSTYFAIAVGTLADRLWER
jgi:membrane-bound lytic murein transglycosylase B